MPEQPFSDIPHPDKNDEIESFDLFDPVRTLRGFYRLFEHRIRLYFGTVGLIVLRIVIVSLILGALVWWEWDSIKVLPGVSQIVETLKALPSPNKKLFSVALLPIENDRNGDVENIIRDSLNQFSSIQTVEFDRTIDMTNPDHAREQAHALAQQSHFDIVIWGTYLEYDGKPKTVISWTTARETMRRGKELSLSDNFDFTADSWQQLGNVLGLVTATSAAAFLNANEGRYIADQLGPFIKRTRTLLADDASKHEISARTRAKISVLLGDALYIRGDQSGQSDALEEAITSYTAALQEYTRAHAPLDWAATENGLGTALETLGEREPGTANLRKATDAYNAALQVYTRERAPLQWAMTQNNLGAALEALGEREPGTASLHHAADAFNAALQIETRARMPLEWAATQNNLGIALERLGERESGTASLRKALDAFNAALQEDTRERVPLDWAMTENNLGGTLARLGERESGTESLQRAADAFNAALQGYTRERVPLDWAMTENNLGRTLARLGIRESGTASLQRAVEAFNAALQEYTRERAPLEWATTENNLGDALEALGERESGTASLHRAVDAYNAALQERTRERVPLEWAATQNSLGIALARLGEREPGPAILRKAVEAFDAALQVYASERMLQQWSATQRNLLLVRSVLKDVSESWSGFPRAGYGTNSFSLRRRPSRTFRLHRKNTALAKALKSMRTLTCLGSALDIYTA